MQSPDEHQPQVAHPQLDGWDAAYDVGVSWRPLAGLTVAGPGEHPLANTIAHPCPDDYCDYRVASIRLFGTIRELLAAHVLRPARECEMSPMRYFRELDIRVWGIRAVRPLRTAELDLASISERVPLTAPALGVAALDSPSCEVVRRVCDLAVDGIRLPTQEGELGESQLVLRSAWDALELSEMGSLTEALPLLREKQR